MNPAEFSSSLSTYGSHHLSQLHKPPRRRPRPSSALYSNPVIIEEESFISDNPSSLPQPSSSSSLAVAPQGIVTQATQILQSRISGGNGHAKFYKPRVPFHELQVNGRTGGLGRQDSPDATVSLAACMVGTLALEDDAHEVVAGRHDTLGVAGGQEEEKKENGLIGGWKWSGVSSSETTKPPGLTAQRALRRGNMLGKEMPRRRKSVMSIPSLTASHGPPMPPPMHEDPIKEHQDDDNDNQTMGDVTKQLARFESAFGTNKDDDRSRSRIRRSSLVVAPRRIKIARETNSTMMLLPTLSEDAEKVGRPALAEKKGWNRLQERKVEGIDAPFKDSIHLPLSKPTVEIPKPKSLRKFTFAASATDLHPAIQQNIAYPELYHDNWISQQETAITNLLNSFFQAHDPLYNKRLSPVKLRSLFLKLHDTAETAQLARRLQASLVFGALSVPKSLFASSFRLRDDVGQRRQFLDALLDSYNPVYLVAALEVVIGREFGSQSSPPSRKGLEAFIDSFLIHHSDMPSPTSSSSLLTPSLNYNSNSNINSNSNPHYCPFDHPHSPEWAWKRTALRTMLLIRLLDQVKASTALPPTKTPPLFLSTSVHKTSEALLKHMATSVLLPSHGDVIRTLKHLGYSLHHCQHTTAGAMQDYKLYPLQNIAVDMRDGIRLAHLAYALGAPEPPPLLSSVSSANCLLLKYPAPSRATKLHNAAIALRAIVTVPHLIVSNLDILLPTPEDIVDGHREKTVGLLWALLAPYSAQQEDKEAAKRGK